MALHQNVSGTWKSLTAHINVGGTWKQAVVWKNVSGTWKQITGSSFSVTLTDDYVLTSGTAGTLSASWGITTAGNVTNNGSTDYAWLLAGAYTDGEAQFQGPVRLINHGTYGVGTTSLTLAQPTSPSPSVGDLLLMTVISRASNSVNTPSGWTEIANGTATYGSEAADSGTVRVQVFYRVRQSGDSLGNISVTKTTETGTMMLGRISTYRPAFGSSSTHTWSLQGVTASDVDGGSSLSASGSLDLEQGDYVVALVAGNSDHSNTNTAGMTLSGGSAFTAGNKVNSAVGSTTSTNGNDGRYLSQGFPVDGSDYSGTVTVTATMGGTGYGYAVALVRIRCTTAYATISGQSVSISRTTVGESLEGFKYRIRDAATDTLLDTAAVQLHVNYGS